MPILAQVSVPSQRLVIRYLNINGEKCRNCVGTMKVLTKCTTVHYKAPLLSNLGVSRDVTLDALFLITKIYSGS